jgi:YD repeat-containing protein
LLALPRAGSRAPRFSTVTQAPSSATVSDRRLHTYSYSYDAEGNLIERTNIATGAVTDYTWDARDRLTEVTDYASAGGPATQAVQYYYDADCAIQRTTGTSFFPEARPPCTTRR